MMQTPSFHFTRTRIAPTPSGYLHLGNVLSFAITATLAKRYGAKILLRIDDMDRERVERAYVQDIFDTLNYLSIPWDEGPRDTQEFAAKYSQLHRMDLYNEALQSLRATDKLFACDCSRAMIQRDNAAGFYTGRCADKAISFDMDECNWRLRTDDTTPVMMHTLQGDVSETLPIDVAYFAVRKKDTFPAYQLCSVVDDLHFKVDFIVRGEDLYASTLAQLFLANEMNAAAFLHTTFYHHPLLMENGGQKLSKSNGSTSIQHLRQSGKSPEEIFAIIGALAGVTQPVHSWETLGNALLPF